MLLRLDPALIRLALSALLAVSFAAGAAEPAGPDETEPAAPPAAAATAPSIPAVALTPRQQAAVQYHVMAGEVAAGREQPKMAAEQFMAALAILPDPALATRATQLAIASGDLTLAQRAAKLWLSLEPTSMDAREIIARIALRRGDLDETYAQCLAIIEGHAGGEADGYRHVALLLAAENGKGPEVEGLLAKLIAKHPDLAAAHYALALAALRYDDLPQAEKSARKALSIDPEARDATLLLIGVLVRTGKTDESDGLMDKLLAGAKDKSDLRLTYAKLLLEGGQRDHARRQLELTLRDDPKSDDARYALGVLAFNDGKLDEAAGYFTPIAADPERGADAEFQLGRIDEARKRYPEALKHYDRVISGNQAIEAAIRRAAVMTKMGQVEDARASLDQIRRQFPPLAMRLTLAEADMLLDAGRFDDALAVYGEVLAKDPDDADMLYGRSLVYERMDKFAEAEADLRAILVHHPDDGRAMNALGYMLTVNTTRYDEAQKLISRALEMDPEDAAVIDSMGWVQYKRGHAAEARTWLQKALAKAPDPEISAHLGEVLWTLGEHEKAREVWDKALAREPDHRVLLDTVDRMTR